MITVAVLLFILNGKIVFERTVVKSVTECEITVGKRITDLKTDPRFDGGIWAGCVQEQGKSS